MCVCFLTDHPQFTKRVLKAIAKERLAEAQSSGLRLCVDLSMTDGMSDKVGELDGVQSTTRPVPSQRSGATVPTETDSAACVHVISWTVFFLGGAGGESPRGPVEEAVRVEQEGDPAVSPPPDGPGGGRPALQRVPADERGLPQLHGDYCQDTLGNISRQG